MPISKTKVTVIGNGFVGASAAYAMAIKGLAAEMVLIDVNRNHMEKLWISITEFHY